MNRLTYQKNGALILDGYDGFTKSLMLHKLYALENLEQELECPLEAVFKLIGSHIILDGEPCYVMGILKDGDKLCIHYSKCYGAYDDIEPLSNYGKTFWIDEEGKTE